MKNCKSPEVIELTAKKIAHIHKATKPYIHTYAHT